LIRAVIFDLGGTLFEFNPKHLPWLAWERAGLEGAHACLSAQGHDLPLQAFIDHVQGMLPERWERAVQGIENLRLGDVLHEACAACGVTPVAGEVQAAVECYIDPLDARVVMYDDAPDTLRALRQRGLKIGLISNTMWPDVYHRRQLERFGLLPFFDHCLFSADAGIWKPQPGIYRRALAALGVSAAEAVFVGDLPQHDVVGAQGVGIRAVYKRSNSFTNGDVQPDATITDLAELLPLVEAW
jgi:putative hydrolase of the HAD superfamily